MNANRLTNDDLLAIGFKNLSDFTVGHQVKYNLSRRRYLVATNVGTPNESVWLCHKEKDDELVSDLICVHNFDYDGFITVERLKALIDWFEAGDSLSKSKTA